MNILVTGGAGFVGWHLTARLLSAGHYVTIFDIFDPLSVVNPDLGEPLTAPRLSLIRGDILDCDLLTYTARGHDLIIHAAAQSSVDRSIKDPVATFTTNATGTVSMLEAARAAGVRRVHYVSTDEVFGPARVVTSVQNPTNPYSAGKAAGEAAASAWRNTYGLQVTITNSANTYGPRQAPEKFVPRLITRAIRGESLPIYGDGRQAREWVHVTDHCSAIMCAAFKGRPGTSYGIGTGELIENIDVARSILDALKLPYHLLAHVDDRPGHDRSYAVDAVPLRRLGWSPATSFAQGLASTIAWYRDNRRWVAWFSNRS